MSSATATQSPVVFGSTPTTNPPWRLPSLALIWFLCLGASALIHWSDGQYSERTFIDYDDLQVITPMLKLTWTEYWQNWFPDRTNYAFPIRDLTHFLDQMAEPYATQGFFWVTHFLYHALAMFFVLLTFNRILGPRKVLPLACFAIVVFHNFNTEVLQWLTCRKYVVPALPLAVGCYLISKWYGQAWQHKRGLILFLLWLVSIGAYPTSALWIFWAFAALWVGQRPQRIRTIVIWLGIAATTCISYLALVGKGTGEVNAGLSSIFMNPYKSWTLGTEAIGRGFWNLLFPFSPAPYYSELRSLGDIGLGLFILVTVLMIVKVARARSWTAHTDLSKALIWLALGLILIVPTVNTILSFHDFMLADRHLYLSLPWFVASGALFLRAWLSEREGPSLESFKTPITIGALAALLIWLGFSVKTALDYVPQWRNSYTLMEQCVFRERSPRCHSQTIRRVFFKDKCHLAAHIMESAADLYKDLPPFSLEFRTEVPFFHSSCIALSAGLTPDQKIEAIEKLAPVYKESPDIMFALVLAHLEKGDLPGAFGVASGYYMGPLDLGPIFITSSMLAVYRGHLEVLCRYDPSGRCSAALARYHRLHPGSAPHGGANDWGMKVTELMAKRGGLGGGQ